MTAPRSLQQWVHWLEVGPGARLIRLLAVFLGLVLLSGAIVYKQFRGPLNETTFQQLVVARQLGRGQGFTTPVNYPRTLAWMKDHGQRFDPARPLPELEQAPLYPAVVGLILRVVPEWLRDGIFATAPTSSEGFAADYFVLTINLVLFWAAAGLTFVLGRRLFGPLVGAIALGGLILSVSLWNQVLSVNGTPLSMVLILAAFYALARADAEDERKYPLWLALAGAAAGLLFLTDYTAGATIFVFAAYAWVRFAGVRGRALGALLAAFFVVAAPWCVRNFLLTETPIGLAWEDVALKAGDSFAEPNTLRTTLSSLGPVIDLNKLGNKGLTAIQRAVQEKLWSAGGLLLTAFFVAGVLYRFRDATADRLRWWFIAWLAGLTITQAFFNSGEGERLPLVYAAPLMIVFGAGFFAVLVASNEKMNTHAGWAAAFLLGVQALPLAHDLIEPPRLHFNFPPYYPGLFVSLQNELASRRTVPAAWMADVPAGASWYSGQRVWAQPASLRDFYEITVEQPVAALVLTPRTLDRPFFAELTRPAAPEAGKFGDWAQVYSGLATGKLPAAFPLAQVQKVGDDLYVLIDPAVLATPARRGK